MGTCQGVKVSTLEEWSQISLPRAKFLSGNPSITNSRYHCGLESRTLQDDYEVFEDEVIGTGFSGNVVLAKGLNDRRKYALKRLRKPSSKGKELRRVLDEVEIYLSLDHPNIARLRDVYETSDEVACLTEFCEGGELFVRLTRSGTFCEEEAKGAIRQILRALGYLHSHGIAHRDIKLENFLYETNNGSTLKLIDFGFAKIWRPSSPMREACGSLAYVSPEIINKDGYTTKCDMWSLGVLTFMLLLGYPPFHGSKREMHQRIKVGQADWSFPKRLEGVSCAAIDFIRDLLRVDPGTRLDARQALSHPWLAGQTGSPRISRDCLRSMQRYQAAPPLRRTVLQLLAQELTPAETMELRQVFLDLDVKNEGVVHLEQLKEAILGARGARPEDVHSEDEAALFPRHESRTNSMELEELFSALDANGDNEICFTDFLAATMDARKELRPDMALAAFVRLDADGSGTVSAKDIGAVFGCSEPEGLIAEVGCQKSLGFHEFMLLAQGRDKAEVEPAICL